MRKSITFLLILIATSCLASKTDSLFQRHQISISLTNAMSHLFYKDYDPTKVNNSSSTSSNLVTFPNYGMHLNIKYSVGVSEFIRIETGIGYKLCGVTVNFIFDNYYYSRESGTIYSYGGDITIPIHVKFIIPLKKGAFTSTLGPMFDIPIHNVSRVTNYMVDHKPLPDHTYNTTFTSEQTSWNASMGFDLKMGYEKQLARNISLDICPIVNFSNLLIFYSKNEQSNIRPYRYYIGLDLSFNFGLKK